MFWRKKETTESYQEIKDRLGVDEDDTQGTLYGYNYKAKQNRGNNPPEKRRSRSEIIRRDNKRGETDQLLSEEFAAIDYWDSKGYSDKNNKKLGEEIADNSVDKKWWERL